MDLNNDNIDNNNYKFYKKVFNNIVISKLIFEYVYKLNYNQIYHSNFFNEKYKAFLKNEKYDILDQGVNKFKFSYNSIPFNKIFQYGLLSIFKDKIKTKTKSNLKISSLLLSRFLNQFSGNITNEEFKTFYYLNKNLILNYNSNEDDEDKINNKNQKDDASDGDGIRKQDIFELLVENKQFEFLKIIYQDEIILINKEKEFYYKEKEKLINSNTCSDRLLDSYDFIYSNLQYNLEKPPFYVYSNFQLVKTAFQSSTLEIIKFLNEIVQLDFKHYSSNLLYWSIKNNKFRNELVNWLLDEFKYKVPLVYNGIYDQFYNYLYRLNYKTFKRVVVKEGSPMLMNTSVSMIIFAISIDDSMENKGTPIYKLIDSVLIATLSTFQFTKSIEYMVYLKLFKQLIKYDKNPSDQLKITSTSIQSLIKKLYSKYYNQQQEFKKQKKLEKQKILEKQQQQQSPPSILKSFFNLFNNNNNNSIDSTTTTFEINENQIPKSLKEFKENKKKNYLLENLTEFSNIDYNQFNLEREIKRIYILEFLNSKKLFIEESRIKIILFSIIDFIVKFELFELFDCLMNKHSSLMVSTNMEKRIFEQILKNLNFKIYIHFKNNNYFPQLSSSVVSGNRDDVNRSFPVNYYLFNKENINFYIDFLKEMIKYNDIHFNELFPFALSTLDNENDIESIEKMIKILKNYEKVPKNIVNITEIKRNLIRKKNEFLRLYFYKNYNHLFIGDWEIKNLNSSNYN